MGWASGSSLFIEVIAVLQPEIEDQARRKEIYKKLITAFENEDWDTQDECRGNDPAYDEALEELHRDWFD